MDNHSFFAYLICNKNGQQLSADVRESLSLSLSLYGWFCVYACILKFVWIEMNRHLYLPPAAEGRARDIIKRLLYLCPSVCSSRFYINLDISFIYKDIFSKFVGNVYGYKNLSVQNFDFILKNKMAAIANCLKIIKVL